MAGVDTFDSFVASLSRDEKQKLKSLISDWRAEMFAARSEDARVRLAHEFTEEVHKRRKTAPAAK